MKYVIRERNTLPEHGPLGWPRAFVAVPDDAPVPRGAEVWTEEQREAWEADPQREVERSAWEAARGVADAPASRKVIRSLAFLDRLPLYRQAEILMAARRATARGDATVELLLLRLGAATEIDLADPTVIEAVRMMADAGIITRYEEHALLADPNERELP